MESARPSVFTASNGEGVERVAKGKGELKDIFERKEYAIILLFRILCLSDGVHLH